MNNFKIPLGESGNLTFNENECYFGEDFNKNVKFSTFLNELSKRFKKLDECQQQMVVGSIMGM